MVWNEHAVGQSGSAAPTTALPLPDPLPRGRAREAGKVADHDSEENQPLLSQNQHILHPLVHTIYTMPRSHTMQYNLTNHHPSPSHPLT